MKNRYLSIGCPKFATIQNEPKRNPQLATTIRDRLFLNHVHNQAGFGKPVIKGGGFIYLGISKMVLTF